MTNTSDAAPASAANGERTIPNNPHMPDEMQIMGGRFAPGTEPNKLGSVNRAPRWLLPTVLTALVLTVVVGALLS
ncbi:hypothetical protein GCM10009546_40630 [Actinomadura livida]|uniref:Uncharacterized protein n=2 Tax=Actinomadura livida TaxID=79909 RepID=A0ABP3PW92_9ACTN|nr:hypothetical protein GCM10010208_47810 [Actinomadura livida]